MLFTNPHRVQSVGVKRLHTNVLTSEDSLAQEHFKAALNFTVGDVVQ